MDGPEHLERHLCYDAEAVDRVLETLGAQVRRLQSELREAVERAERSEQRADAAARDVGLVVDALLRLPAAMKVVTSPPRALPARVAAPVARIPEVAAVSVAPVHAVGPSWGADDDAFLAELRRSLDDNEPLGPRPDSPALGDLEPIVLDVDSEWWVGPVRAKRPLIRARRAWTLAMSVVSLASAARSASSIRTI